MKAWSYRLKIARRLLCANVHHLPTGMFEVVTAVAWDEWEGIVIVTIVLVGACVCDTDPAEGKKKILNSSRSLHYRLLQPWESPRGKVPLFPGR